ncbi:MAG: transketolase C-terminal domain-containing protein, partial [Trebonia sp.]
AAVRQAAASPRPTFIRVGRIKVPDLPVETTTLERGRFQLLRDGPDVTIVAIGTTVARALEAATRLAREGVSARVLNAVYLAPLDSGAILAAADDTSAIVTAEEANVAGGLGAAVAAVVLQGGARQRVPLEMLGFRDFAPTGDVSFLLERSGLTAEGIAQAVQRALRL